MVNNITNKGMTLLVTGTILMSGLCGFGGSYIANNLKAEQVSVQSTTSSAPTVIQTSVTGASSSNKSNTSNTGGLSIVDIAALTSETVVEITTETVSMGSRMGQYVSEGAGSGVIVSKDGYIATNNHVIDGASKITVRLKNGEDYTAKLIGTDAKTDLAVLKIDADNLQAAVFGDSDNLVVGELTVAIGNPLGELGGTVTEGIVSALDREIVIDDESMTLLQTSAAINPGNSGGGLFNSNGELIGIVNAKSSGSDIEGLGFAIPSNTAKEVIEQIISYGYVQGRISLGMTLLDISDARTAMVYRVQNAGVYVSNVTTATSFRAGDRIVSINGTSVSTASEVKAIIDKYTVGDSLIINVQRGNSSLDITLTLSQAK